MTDYILKTETAKFPLGKLVMTAGASRTFTPDFMAQCIKRHSVGDWGDLCPEDRALNDDALKNTGRLVSSYQNGDDKLWIITEWDRSVTTLLLPAEY